MIDVGSLPFLKKKEENIPYNLDSIDINSVKNEKEMAFQENRNVLP